MTQDETDLEKYGKELQNVKTDSQFEWAEVAHVTVLDDGLGITWKMASGREVYEEYDTPQEWTMSSSRLVMLLDYWGLPPQEIDRLTLDETAFEIPITYDVGEDVWRPDWGTIEQTTRGDDSGG